MEQPMTYEQMMQLLTLGNENEQTAAMTGIMSEQQKAEALRQQELIKGLRSGAPQMRRAGNVNVAPHPMELIGNLARERSANMQSDKMRSDQQAMYGQQMSAQQRMAQQKMEQMRLMLQGLTGGQQQQPSAPPMGTGITPGPGAGYQGVDPAKARWGNFGAS